MYDLHIHTTASDGILSPEEVIDKSINMGLRGISITDHDTVDGLETAEKYLAEINTNLKFIPGIELNTDYKNSEVHILGYFIDYYDKLLLNKLIELKNSRYDRAEKMISKLRSMGFIIDIQLVEKIAGSDIIGRPHIAQALVDKGYVFSVKEAFDKYISKGRPAYVPRYKFLPEEAINLIKNAGGIAVLAHPGLIKNNDIVEEILEMGIEGIEVYYPEHHPIQVGNYLKICRERNLLITGGSDFHGIGSGDSRSRLGCAGINEELFTRLFEYHKKE